MFLTATAFAVCAAICPDIIDEYIMALPPSSPPAQLSPKPRDGVQDTSNDEVQTMAPGLAHDQQPPDDAASDDGDVQQGDDSSDGVGAVGR